MITLLTNPYFLLIQCLGLLKISIFLLQEICQLNRVLKIKESFWTKWRTFIGMTLTYSNIVLIKNFKDAFLTMSFSHPGQMADNGTPWLLSRFFQFPMITDICVYFCVILCSFFFLWISHPILIWKWTPLLKNWKSIFLLCLRIRLQKFIVLGVKDWGC